MKMKDQKKINPTNNQNKATFFKLGQLGQKFS